ncbi:MAG: dual specificity protein kinase kns1 [Chaenotheca gracillima]|nr:MAG: dual specificity protein kinase kns1 [Chaenotheca gracillima]
MAQPPQSYTPPLYPMSPAATNSANHNFLPPNKRQRLSPNPSSPTAMSPNSSNTPQQMTLPGTGAMHGGGPVMSPQATGAMGPPSRPLDKPTNTSDLTDAIAQSGIDIKDEENNLTAYFSQSRPQNDGSFTSNNISSFDSTISSGSDSGLQSSRSTHYPFVQPFQQGPGPYFGAGPIQQPPTQRKSPDEVAKEEYVAAARRQAQTKSIHLNDPFLSGNSVRLRANRRAYENGLRLPQEGYSQRPLQPPRRVSTATLTGPDGSSLTNVSANLLDGDSQLSEILALISLATAERLRKLVEEASSLAIGRRAGSHGQVSAEWQDLATKTIQPTNGTVPGTEVKEGWESAVSPMTNPLKRAFSSANDLPTPVSDRSKSPANSQGFPNDLAKAIRSVASKEHDIEEARVAKRARRANTASSSADGSRSGSVSLGTPGPGTPAGTPGDRAPDVEVKKVSKKELARQQSARVDEAHQHKSANSTARMMLGGGSNFFGKKKGKGYSWMNTGGGGPGASTGNKGNATTGGLETGSVEASAAGSAPGVLPGRWGRRMGEWREDRDRGAGIQLRDFVNALEADGKEHRSLAFAYSKLK